MTKLTKEMIDGIFEPRRGLTEIPFNRLLSDGRRFYCLGRERDGHKLVPQWFILSRPAPNYEYMVPPSKGTYPAWIRLPNCAEATIDTAKLFEVLPKPSHQQSAIVDLYRVAFPQWDSIVKIDGRPRVSKNTALYIMNKFMAYDRRMHPNCMNGGAWMNCGFSSYGPLLDWQIDLSQCKVAYTDTPFYFTIRRSDYGDNAEYSSFYMSLVWDGGLQGDVDEDPESGRVARKSLDAAMAACQHQAGVPLTWAAVPPMKFDGAWQSNIVQPMRKAA